MAAVGRILPSLELAAALIALAAGAHASSRDKFESEILLDELVVPADSIIS